MFAEPPPPSIPEAPVPVVAAWRRWDPLLGIGILIASLVVTYVVAAVLLVGFDLTGYAEDVALAALGVGYELTFAGATLLIARSRGIGLADLGFRRPEQWWPVGVAVVGSYGALIAWGLIVVALEDIGVDTSWIEGGNEIIVDEEQSTARLILLLAILGIAVTLVAPLAEELFFRGMLFSALDRVWMRWAAIFVSGLAFGAFHLNLPVLVPFTVIGMIFAWAFRASGSLWVTILAHFIINTVSFIVTVAGVFS